MGVKTKFKYAKLKVNITYHVAIIINNYKYNEFIAYYVNKLS